VCQHFRSAAAAAYRCLPDVPGIVVAAVFAFIFVWTEFFFALNLTSRNAFTLPTIFRAFLGFQASPSMARRARLP
jgi:ABC-type glycerol-3-phosphate transport system permease component